jgi:hypothetical protein
LLLYGLFFVRDLFCLTGLDANWAAIFSGGIMLRSTRLQELAQGATHGCPGGETGRRTGPKIISLSNPRVESKEFNPLSCTEIGADYG